MSAEGQRIGVFGGTFDPPHVGHLVTAIEARHALGLDRVLLVVANEPWHKPAGRAASSAQDRLAMVGAAVRGVGGLEASDLEIRRGGPSYTFDTLSELNAETSAELTLIVGADAAAGIGGWHRAGELPGLARLAVVDRPGAKQPGTPPGWVTTRVHVPQLDISSSALRERIREGAPVDFLVPAGVVAVIERRGIYR